MALVPPPGIDPRRYGDPGLARHLLTARGEQWLSGEESGDPYALLLRGRAPAPLIPRLWELPEVYRSTTGAWVTARHATAVAALADARLGPGRSGQVLSIAPGLLDEETAPPARPYAPEPDPGGIQHRCAELLEASGEGQTEMISEIVRPLALGTVRGLLGLTPREAPAAPDGLFDAQLCPPQLATARALVRAVDAQRGRLRGVGELALWALGVDAAVSVLAHTLALPLGEGGLPTVPAADEVGDVVDEVLRLEPPVRFETRVARTPLTLGGARIEAGEQLVIAVQAAGRDPRVYTDPNTFLPRRHADASVPRPPWGAAVGSHVPLARLLAVTLLTELAARFPGTRLLEPLVGRCRAPVTGGPLRLRAVLSR